uniref:Helix-turn-helix domain-containing protein n=1 Tax=Heterorhabditis bacteriophora TaxID=37862 RepID=A0A1I7XRQ8_HETBA
MLMEQREKNVAIAKKLCVTRMAVHRIVKRYEELDIAKDRSRSGRPRSVNTPHVRKNVKRILRNNNGSMMKMASNLNISLISMKKIVKN